MQALPDNLLQYVRFAHTLDEATARKAAAFPPGGAPLDPANEHTVLLHLSTYLQARLTRCCPHLTYELSSYNK